MEVDDMGTNEQFDADLWLAGAISAMRSDAATWDREEVLESLKAGSYGPNSSEVMASRIGLGHRIAWSIPEDSVAPGWEVIGGDSEAAQDISHALGLASALVQAGGSARIGEGSWLWPVVDDERWDQPLPEGPHEIHAVHALDDKEVHVIDLERDPRQKGWARPRMVNLAPNRNGLSWGPQVVHASRLIYVPGAPKRAGWSSRQLGYDLSIMDLYRSAILGYQGSSKSVSRLSERLSMAWVKLKSGVSMQAGRDGGHGAVRSKLELLKKSMRTAGLYVLLGDDEAGWSGPSLAGIRDASNVLAEAVSSVEGIPLSKLIGQAPGGLTTDDEAGRRNYNSALDRYRKRTYTNALLRFYEIAMGQDESRRIKWLPLDVPKASDSATTSEALARRDVLLFQAGIIEAAEVRARLATPEAVDPILMDDDELEASELPLMLPALIDDESEVDESMEVQDVDDEGEE